MTEKFTAILAHVWPPRRVADRLKATGRPQYWMNGPAKYKTEIRRGRYVTCRYTGYSPFDTPQHIYEEDERIGDGPPPTNYPHDLKTKGIAVEDIK